MAIDPPGIIANVWRNAGGDPAAAAIAAAVAMAESGGDTNAVSPTTDFGLWQINAVHFGGAGGINATDWWTPTINARAAIAISANGSNWAAWCTAWVTPQANCGHGFLPIPQAGSPAGNQLAALGGAGATVGTGAGGQGGGGGAPVGTTPTQEWERFRTWSNRTGPATLLRLQGITEALWHGQDGVGI